MGYEILFVNGNQMSFSIKMHYNVFKLAVKLTSATPMQSVRQQEPNYPLLHCHKICVIITSVLPVQIRITKRRSITLNLHKCRVNSIMKKKDYMRK